MPAKPGLLPFVVAVALGSTAYIAGFTSASVAAREITGSAQLSGLPSAFGTLGTAVGIGFLSALMGRRGRRPGLLLGYALAVGGAAISVVAIAAASFPFLVAGSVAIGFGNAALQLSRYAASDLVPEARRAAAVGMVVWGSTVGAVLGPNLVQPAGTVAEAFGRTALEGGLAVTLIGFALTLVVTVLFVRATPPGSGEGTGPGIAADALLPDPPEPVSRRALGSSARVRIAIIAMVSGQIVMVLVMTMAPVHVHEMGHDLATVGFVISAHTLGMFALSPVSGRLVTRFGTIPVIYAGFAVLLSAAVLASVARETDIPVLAAGLFLLGYGWNLAYVAGSSLLTAGASLAERIRLQGTVDVGVWVSSGLASISSGFLLSQFGYGVLSMTAGALLLVPAIAIAAQRRRLPAE
jgi:MFS family permease